MEHACLLLLPLILLGSPARADGDVAAQARRDVAQYIEDSLATEAPKPSPFLTAANAYRVQTVVLDEKQAHVTVAFRLLYTAEICRAYYRPARWHSITFHLDRSALGSRDAVASQMKIHLLGRRRVAEIERATLYYVIAGCFRSEKRAEQHAAWASRLVEYGFVVKRSSDYAGLRPGYFIVVQECGFPWQTEDLEEARSRVAMYRGCGIDSYIARIPPLRRRPAEAPASPPPR